MSKSDYALCRTPTVTLTWPLTILEHDLCLEFTSTLAADLFVMRYLPCGFTLVAVAKLHRLGLL
jgi:hypothetical protein